MKILIVHYRYFITGGPERYLFNVMSALEERGHEVIPFSIRTSKNIPTKYENYFVDNIGNSDEVFVHKYPKTVKTYIDLIGREFYSFKVKRALVKLIKKEKPDLCYLLVYKRALSPSVVDACVKYGIPVVNRISDYNTVCGAGSLYRNGQYCELCLRSDIYCTRNKCVKGSFLYSLMRYLSIRLHKALGISNKIRSYICTNQYMAIMMEKYGYPKEKLHVVPTFFKESEEINKWDKSNNIANGIVQFLYIGNIDESKGIYDLLDAIGFLSQKTSYFHLHIVGGLHAEENKRVSDIIESTGIREYITFVPFMTTLDVYRYYLSTNVTIIPTRWVENLPNTLVESIYFERPVVVPNFGSFLFTTDESVAFRYDALNSESLGECLLQICEDQNQIRVKSSNCRSFFKQHYSEDSHLEKLLGILKEG